MIRNVGRALSLDRSFYATIGTDASSTLQATVVVLATGLVASTASWVGDAEGSVRHVFQEVLFGMVGWILSAVVVLIVGTRLMRGSSTLGQVARALGFASAPRALFAFGLLGTLVGGFWIAVAGLVATRATLGIGWVSALATVMLAVVPWSFAYLIATEIVLS